VATVAYLVSGRKQCLITKKCFIIFKIIIYVADLEEWLQFARATTYADDTRTSASSKNLARVIEKLEKDAVNVLKFMAFNRLVPNPNKTVFMMLNNKILEIMQ
jgi:hypothetical protein